MFFTLGGLGIWALIDFLFILFGLMDDAENLPVKRWGARSPLVTIVLLIVFSSSLYFSYRKMQEGVSASAILAFAKNFNFDVATDFDPVVLRSKEAEPFEPLKPVQRESNNDLVTWVDEKGVKHYVNDIEKVPAKYRKQAEAQPKLPDINWVPGDKSD